MKMKLFALATGLTLALTVGARAQQQAPPVKKELWTTDYKQALAQAKKENKIVLLDFTGSDWCGYCKMLKAEVFDTAQFKDFAAKNLVLVELDFPKHKTLPQELARQNGELFRKFDVQNKGFPTLILLDGTGKQITIVSTGYRPGTSAAFLQRLKQIVGKAATPPEAAPAPAPAPAATSS